PAGRSASLTRSAGAGSGPFELRPGAAGTVVLARNTTWWGTSRGLGPALDQVELRVVASAAARARLLRRADLALAWGISHAAAERLRRDPLLTTLVGPDHRSIGLERSVRGIDSATAIPLLSAVWLTTIGA